MRNTRFNMSVSFFGWVAFMAVATVADGEVMQHAAIGTSMVFLVSGFIHVAILEAVKELKR